MRPGVQENPGKSGGEFSSLTLAFLKFPEFMAPGYLTGKLLSNPQPSQPNGKSHPGQSRFETAQAKAGRMVAEELTRRKWTEPELAARPKAVAVKLALGARWLSPVTSN